MEADIEEILFKRDNMVIVGCACDFRLIVACLREEAGDLTTEVMEMTPASGEKDPGGFWEDSR